MLSKTDYPKVHGGDHSYLSFSSDRLSTHCALHCHDATRSLAKNQTLKLKKLIMNSAILRLQPDQAANTMGR